MEDIIHSSTEMDFTLNVTETVTHCIVFFGICSMAESLYCWVQDLAPWHLAEKGRLEADAYVSIILATQIFTWVEQLVTFPELERLSLKMGPRDWSVQVHGRTADKMKQGWFLDWKRKEKFGAGHCHFNITWRHKRAGKARR